jgi:hypothetical protein
MNEKKRCGHDHFKVLFQYLPERTVKTAVNFSGQRLSVMI